MHHNPGENAIRRHMSVIYRINIYACFITISVAHEVKNQRALAKRTCNVKWPRC